MHARALVWSDEFDGPSGSPPSAAWTAELRAPADNDNGELQRYTASLANASLDGHGHLAITAASDGGAFTSARLVSKGRVELLFGRVATRVRAAARRRSVAGRVDARQRHRRGRLARLR